MLPRIKEARHIGEYRLELTFTDGTRGEVDLKDWVVGQGGVFAQMEDVAFFARVSVNHELGTIAWPNDVDFCPDVLLGLVKGRAAGTRQTA
jgi:hypothetical protein